jgi:hypothetical protein
MIVEKTTHARAYIESSDRLKIQICKLLECDEMGYAQYQEWSGLEYLKCYFNENERYRTAAKFSKAYWNWFKVLWNNDDYVFRSISGLLDMPLKESWDIYDDLHCPRVLATEWKPNAVVLAEIKNKVA